MLPIDEILETGSAVADEVEVFLTEGITVSAELKRTKVSRAEESLNFGFTIRTIKEGRIGNSSSNNPADWKRCLGASVASGRLATPQPWDGLPGPAPVDGSPLGFDPALAADPDAVIHLLEGMVQGAASHPVEVTSGGASISLLTLTLANSHGVCYSRPQSHVSASLETIRGNSTGHEFGISPTLDLDPVAIGERAGFLAAASQGGSDIRSGPYDIVLSPHACAQLLGAVLIPSLSGRSVHAGRSKLAQSMGLQVTDKDLSIRDDPFLERGLSSTRWDAEGVPTRMISFIREGILESFAYDLKTAYRYEKESTGSAIRSGPGGSPAIGAHTIIVDGRRENVMDGQGVYIEDVVGAHTANPTSGDFSVELTNPFRIEGGEYGEPIRKAMLSGNVFEMLNATDGLGKDDRLIGSFLIPSIRVRDQQLIGV